MASSPSILQKIRNKINKSKQSYDVSHSPPPKNRDSQNTNISNLSFRNKNHNDCIVYGRSSSSVVYRRPKQSEDTVYRFQRGVCVDRKSTSNPISCHGSRDENYVFAHKDAHNAHLKHSHTPMSSPLHILDDSQICSTDYGTPRRKTVLEKSNPFSTIEAYCTPTGSRRHTVSDNRPCGIDNVIRPRCLAGNGYNCLNDNDFPMIDDDQDSDPCGGYVSGEDLSSSIQSSSPEAQTKSHNTSQSSSSDQSMKSRSVSESSANCSSSDSMKEISSLSIESPGGDQNRLHEIKEYEREKASVFNANHVMGTSSSESEKTTKVSPPKLEVKPPMLKVRTRSDSSNTSVVDKNRLNVNDCKSRSKSTGDGARSRTVSEAGGSRSRTRSDSSSVFDTSPTGSSLTNSSLDTSVFDSSPRELSSAEPERWPVPLTPVIQMRTLENVNQSHKPVGAVIPTTQPSPTPPDKPVATVAPVVQPPFLKVRQKKTERKNDEMNSKMTTSMCSSDEDAESSKQHAKEMKLARSKAPQEVPEYISEKLVVQSIEDADGAFYRTSSADRIEDVVEISPSSAIMYAEPNVKGTEEEANDKPEELENKFDVKDLEFEDEVDSGAISADGVDHDIELIKLAIALESESKVPPLPDRMYRSAESRYALYKEPKAVLEDDYRITDTGDVNDIWHHNAAADNEPIHMSMEEVLQEARKYGIPLVKPERSFYSDYARTDGCNPYEQARGKSETYERARSPSDVYDRTKAQSETYDRSRSRDFETCMRTYKRQSGAYRRAISHDNATFHRTGNRDVSYGRSISNENGHMTRSHGPDSFSRSPTKISKAQSFREDFDKNKTLTLIRDKLKLNKIFRKSSDCESKKSPAKSGRKSDTETSPTKGSKGKRTLPELPPKSSRSSQKHRQVQSPNQNQAFDYHMHTHTLPANRHQRREIQERTTSSHNRRHSCSGTNTVETTMETVMHHHYHVEQTTYHMDYDTEGIAMAMGHHLNGGNFDMDDDTALTNSNADFIESLRKLKDCGWYWGPLNWDSAESKLANKPDGSFLVRDSSDDRYILSLSFRSQGMTHHTRIEHYKGMFSFYSQPKSHGAGTIIEFIEKAMEHSRSGKFLYFLRPRAPGLPPAPVQLMYPVSRFRIMASLQHLARFSILKEVRHDHIALLPLPEKMKAYLKEKQYYAEYILDEGSPV